MAAFLQFLFKGISVGSLYAFGAYLAATLSLLVAPISPWLTYPALLVASVMVIWPSVDAWMPAPDWLKG